jgi:hypothetical protein
MGGLLPSHHGPKECPTAELASTKATDALCICQIVGTALMMRGDGLEPAR